MRYCDSNPGNPSPDGIRDDPYLSGGVPFEYCGQFSWRAIGCNPSHGITTSCSFSTTIYSRLDSDVVEELSFPNPTLLSLPSLRLSVAAVRQLPLGGCFTVSVVPSPELLAVILTCQITVAPSKPAHSCALGDIFPTLKKAAHGRCLVNYPR